MLDIVLNEFETKNKDLIVNFEQISCSALVFLLLTLNMFYLLPILTSKYLRMYQIKFANNSHYKIEAI